MPDRFLIFIFTGQLPARMSRCIGMGTVAIGFVAFVMKDGQVAGAKCVALGFEIFDGINGSTCGCVSVFQFIHTRLTALTCYIPFIPYLEISDAHPDYTES